MRKLLVAAALAGALPVGAFAQTATSPVTGARPGNEIGTGASLPTSNVPSNITPGDTRSVIAPNLPSPSVAPGSGPRNYLQAAQQSLAAGRTGEAQQALEQAETRMLDRSVPQQLGNAPSAQPSVADVDSALKALAAGDRSRTQQIIADILARLQG